MAGVRVLGFTPLSATYQAYQASAIRDATRMALALARLSENRSLGSQKPLPVARM